MRFLIISGVLHKHHNLDIGGYGPYIREMNLWLKHVGEVRVIAPIEYEKFDAIDLAYEHPELKFMPVPAFDLTTPKNIIRTFLILPAILYQIFIGMCWADHIHLRCPSNMGLLGCIVQLFFPWKSKTAKYAANWDMKASKPWSYKLQQRLLKNQFICRNIKVMVYGKWPGYTRNMTNFFTATYHELEIEPLRTRRLYGRINIVFVGRLIDGKKPLVVVKALQQMLESGYNIDLNIYGVGPQLEMLDGYIRGQRLEQHVHLRGNVDKECLKHVLHSTHMLLFPTVMSEGWPKVVAESMFWGCVPITTRVSCVPYMLGEGRRGTLIDPTVEAAVAAIEKYLKNSELYQRHSKAAAEWSRHFTLEKFENEIVKLLHN